MVLKINANNRLVSARTRRVSCDVATKSQNITRYPAMGKVSLRILRFYPVRIIPRKPILVFILYHYLKDMRAKPGNLQSDVPSHIERVYALTKYCGTLNSTFSRAQPNFKRLSLQTIEFHYFVFWWSKPQNHSATMQQSIGSARRRSAYLFHAVKET